MSVIRLEPSQTFPKPMTKRPWLIHLMTVTHLTHHRQWHLRHKCSITSSDHLNCCPSQLLALLSCVCQYFSIFYFNWCLFTTLMPLTQTCNCDTMMHDNLTILHNVINIKKCFNNADREGLHLYTEESQFNKSLRLKIKTTNILFPSSTMISIIFDIGFIHSYTHYYYTVPH